MRFSGTASRATGAMIGALLGAGRAFVLITILFIYVSMMPSGPSNGLDTRICLL